MQVHFYDLDGETKLLAVTYMWEIDSENEPGTWDNEDHLKYDLEHGYNPDEDFNFFIDKNGTLEVDEKSESERHNF